MKLFGIISWLKFKHFGKLCYNISKFNAKNNSYSISKNRSDNMNFYNTIKIIAATVNLIYAIVKTYIKVNNKY